MNNCIEYSGLYWMNISDLVLNWIIFRPDSMKKWIFKTYRPGLLGKASFHWDIEGEWLTVREWARLDIPAMFSSPFAKQTKYVQGKNNCIEWRRVQGPLDPSSSSCRGRFEGRRRRLDQETKDQSCQILSCALWNSRRRGRRRRLMGHQQELEKPGKGPAAWSD